MKTNDRRWPTRPLGVLTAVCFRRLHPCQLDQYGERLGDGGSIAAEPRWIGALVSAWRKLMSGGNMLKKVGLSLGVSAWLIPACCMQRRLLQPDCAITNLLEGLNRDLFDSTTST